MQNEQQEPEEAEVDGLLRDAALAIQCGECAAMLQLRVNPDADDLTDLYAECPTCSQQQGMRCGVPLRILVGAEVVQLENFLTELEQAQTAAGIDTGPPFAQGGTLELEGSAGET